jgi:hypothetical protein
MHHDLRCALAALACVASTSVVAADPVCQAGTPRPSTFAILRPTPTATCPYGFAEFQRRLLQFLLLAPERYDIAALDEAIGLPPGETSRDDPRQSDYPRIVGGAGWTLTLWEREGWFPLGVKPDKFVPGPHPTPLGSMADATVDVDVGVISTPELPQPELCFDVGAIDAAAKAANWTKGQQMILDAFGNSPKWTAPDGRRFIGIQGFITPSANCVRGLAIRKK